MPNAIITRSSTRPFHPIQAAGSASVPRRTRALLLLANFGPFAAIIVTALIAYGMAQRGVAPDVVGKVPQVRLVFSFF